MSHQVGSDAFANNYSMLFFTCSVFKVKLITIIAYTTFPTGAT